MSIRSSGFSVSACLVCKCWDVKETPDLSNRAKDMVKREEGTALALHVQVKLEHSEDGGDPKRTNI
jgi:hypothetical protein